MAKRIPIYVLLLALMASAMAGAADPDLFLTVSNDTGFTLSALYLGNMEADDWGPDHLNGNPLLDGENIRIPLNELNEQIVSVRARDNEGDTYTIYGVDAKNEDVIISLLDIDPD